MLIAGFQKTSFVDYPGQMAAVVFTPYCNFNCVYCHNRHILGPDAPLIPEETVLDYLEKRAGLLKAVVVSGGEPTLQQNLDAFIRLARELSYQIKLDTNGSKPKVLKALLSEGLLDYVAMDIKAPMSKYSQIADADVDTDALMRSITHLRNSNVPHEFRLTFAPQFSIEDAVEAARPVKGCRQFYLQQYRIRDEHDPAPHPPSVLQAAAERIREKIGVCTVRNG